MRRLALLTLCALALAVAAALAGRRGEAPPAAARGATGPEVGAAGVPAPAPSPAADAPPPLPTPTAAPPPEAPTASAAAKPPPKEILDVVAEMPKEVALDPRRLAEVLKVAPDVAQRLAAASAERRARSRAAAEAPPGPAPPPAASEAAVRGTVRDAQGAPVEGAIVIAFSWGEARAGAPATSGPDGRYALAHDGISDGRTHRIRFEHRRFRPREVGIAGRKPEDPPTPLDVVLEDGPSLEGVVRRPEGHPAEGAEVAVIGLEARASSDRDGRFRLPVLPPGTHIVVARLPAERLAAAGRALVDADGFPPDERPLTLVLGLEGAIEASGVETLNPGFGPARVELWLGSRAPLVAPPFAAAHPGPDGVARFEGLPPARYVVQLAHPSIGYLTPEPVTVTVSPGARREVWLGRKGTAVLVVRGRGPSGPPPRAVFSAWGDLGSAAAVHTTAGEARIEGLPADRYFVFCNDQTGGLGRAVVTLAAGDVIALELTLLQAGRCTGTLVDERGLPAVGARVTSDTVEGRIAREAVVDDEGKFALEMLYPGSHVIRARLDGRAATRTIQVGVGEVVGPVGMVLGP